MPSEVKPLTKTLCLGRVSRFYWINFEGGQELRHVIFSDIEFRTIPHDPKPQWYATGWDTERQAIRSFALDKIVTE